MRDKASIEGLRGGRYTRVSMAKSGEKAAGTYKSTTDQKTEGQRIFERRGILTAETYSDPDISASRFAAAGYLARIAGLKEQIRALQTPPLLKDFADGDVEAAWNRTLIPVRRDIIKALLSAIEVQRDQAIRLHWRKTPGLVPAGRKPGDGMITLIKMAEAREVALR
jgi:hypothetical protein